MWRLVGIVAPKMSSAELELKEGKKALGKADYPGNIHGPCSDTAFAGVTSTYYYIHL